MREIGLTEWTQQKFQIWVLCQQMLTCCFILRGRLRIAQHSNIKEPHCQVKTGDDENYVVLRKRKSSKVHWSTTFGHQKFLRGESRRHNESSSTNTSSKSPADEKRHGKSKSLIVPNTPFSRNFRESKPIWDLLDDDKVELDCE